MNRIVRCLPVCLLLLSHAGSSQADLTVEVSHDGASQKMYVTPHQFRAEHPEGMLIFRGDRNLVWFVQPAEGKYVELTEETMKGLAAKIEGARSQMEEALKNLPPEQREMAEKMMAGRMPPGMTGEAEKKVVKEMGQSRTINGFRTSGFEVSRGGAQVAEVWTAAAGDLGVDAKEMAVFEEFARFMKTAVPGMEGLVDAYSIRFEDPGEDEVPGFPILRIERGADGSETGRTEVVKIEEGDLPEALFELPEGLEKKPLGL